MEATRRRPPQSVETMARRARSTEGRNAVRRNGGIAAQGSQRQGRIATPRKAGFAMTIFEHSRGRLCYMLFLFDGLSYFLVDTGGAPVLAAHRTVVGGIEFALPHFFAGFVVHSFGGGGVDGLRQMFFPV